MNLKLHEKQMVHKENEVVWTINNFTRKEEKRLTVCVFSIDYCIVWPNETIRQFTIYSETKSIMAYTTNPPWGSADLGPRPFSPSKNHHVYIILWLKMEFL